MISSTQTNHPLGAIPQGTEAAAQSGSRDLICSRLRAAGLRSTQPRISIFKALTELNEPASIEKIFHSIKNSSCDLVTVYRGLALFEELGLVQRTFSNNGTGLYELKREGAPSFHVNCRESGNREVLDSDLSSDLQIVLKKVEASLMERGYSKVSLRVDIQGSRATTTLPESRSEMHSSGIPSSRTDSLIYSQ